MEYPLQKRVKNKSQHAIGYPEVKIKMSGNFSLVMRTLPLASALTISRLRDVT